VPTLEGENLRSMQRTRLLLLLALAALTMVFPLATRAESPNVNTSASISGSAVVGGSLTAHNGTWLYGDGTSCQSDCVYTYQWQRCTPDQSTCNDIGGSTGRFYTVQAADAGSRLRAMETVTKYDCNAHGVDCRDVSKSAPSGMTEVVPGSPSSPPGPTGPVPPTVPAVPVPQAPLAPAVTAAPTVTGVPMVEQTLTATLGTWSGTAPLTVGLEWLRCDAEGESCQGLGITGTTYTVGAVDIGKTLRVKITAANVAGARGALSDPTAVVSALKPTAEHPSIAAAKVTAPHKLVIDQVRAPRRFNGRAMRLTLRVTDSRGFLVEGALVTASLLPKTALTPPTEFTTTADGLVTLEFKRGAKLKAAIKVVTVVVIARRPGDKLASPRGAIVRLKLPVAVAARR
jgi:hypothetical protein